MFFGPPSDFLFNPTSPMEFRKLDSKKSWGESVRQTTRETAFADNGVSRGPPLIGHANPSVVSNAFDVSLAAA